MYDEENNLNLDILCIKFATIPYPVAIPLCELMSAHVLEWTPAGGVIVLEATNGKVDGMPIPVFQSFVQETLNMGAIIKISVIVADPTLSQEDFHKKKLLVLEKMKK
jgi:hypothetical protein